jgi:hypothetical protein
MAPPPIERVLHLGFRFEPKPVDTITYYLPRLIAGVPMHAAVRSFVHATDIYAWEPAELAAHYRPTPKSGDRFFFTTFKRQPGKSIRGVRVAGPGHWHSQGHTKDVLDDEGVKVGEAKKFRYNKGGAFTDWLMEEFSSCAADTVVGDRQYVLCRMYVSSKAAQDSAAHQESAAFVAFSPPPPPAPEGQELVAAAPNSNKRPAPPIAEPSCPTKRIRSAATIPTPPPVVPPPFPSPVQAPAPCSVAVAARDPFCTETDAPAAAAQDDGLADFIFDIDLDFAMSDEGTSWIKQTVEEAPPIAEPPRAVPIPTPPLMEPPPHHWSPPQPSVQTSTAAPAACSPVAARDPFCTDTEPPAAAAQEGDALESEKKAELEEAPAADDWLGSFKLKPANQQVRKVRDPFESFDPTIGRKRKPMMHAY